jgi:YidC/Oxa1 family membrane protein insertase
MDRRLIWAIVLMMLIAVAPSFLFKKPPASRAGGRKDSVQVGSTLTDTVSSAVRAAPSVEAAPAAPAAGAPAVSADTVMVTAPLYTYGISTRGGRLVDARLTNYESMAAGDRKHPAQLVKPGASLHDLTAVSGSDTLRLSDWDFTPSSRRLELTQGQGTLTLTGARDGRVVELTYGFRPDDYQITVSGRIRGMGATGGVLLIGLGTGIHNTEADSLDNQRALGVVTKQQSSQVTKFQSLTPGQTTVLSGPFEWVAVKSKYFVAAVLAFDSTQHLSGATATALPTGEKHPTEAAIQLTLPVPANGVFGYTLYAGPMEYSRLGRIGHDFDDVNPYGWPGFRTMVRFFAAPVRWLLVWMHGTMRLPYGIVLVLFGIMVRLILWPLNQKGMRASMKMQAIQPRLKELQERYKENPQKLNEEMFKLYREEGVNPLGGCWPVLLPWPVLLALFVVFQYSIELRGASFLWLPDLSRPDPFFVLPVLMGLSMFALSKVGQIGMEPNPQMKMMLYFMPVMMTVLFINFASGLNLYYAVSNTVSIPQQWFLAKERLRAKPPAPPPAPAKSKR